MSPSSANSGSATTANTPTSPYAGEVYVEPGNAASAYEPFEEYIVIQASGNLSNPVTITGWKLTNARGERSYQVGNTIERFPSNAVTIGEAVSILNFGQTQSLGPIVLSANQKAIITTGAFNTSAGHAASFRENKCIGYITNNMLAPVTLTPYPAASCPIPTDEPGESNLDQNCLNFIESMGSCHTPNFSNSVYVNNTPQSGFVDGVGGLSTSCRAFVQAHYSYSGCVTNHASDADFLGNTWRVYLNYPTELWASNNETITLWDAQGRVVSTYSY